MHFVSRAQDRDQCLILILSNFKESLVNLRDSKLRTLLHIAAYQNSVACFKVLLNNGAPINLKDQYSRTPLMLACYMGHQRIVGMYPIKFDLIRSDRLDMIWFNMSWFDLIWFNSMQQFTISWVLYHWLLLNWLMMPRTRNFSLKWSLNIEGMILKCSILRIMTSWFNNL